MYRQFNIQQFSLLPTQLYLRVLCGSENKQRLYRCKLCDVYSRAIILSCNIGMSKRIKTSSFDHVITQTDGKHTT